MLKSTKSRAEELFTASLKKDKQVLIDRKKERQKVSDHIASLRSLRLAKEAADKKAADAKDRDQK